MIIYLDTSSLVKLYVEEAQATLVREWVEDAELIATCRVALPETISALDRRFRNGDFSKQDYELLIGGFQKDWQNFVVLDFDEIEAGRLVRKYSLRGFDAVHLSSAKMIKRDASVALFFSSFDEKLNKAAKAEEFEVLML
ncbi:MAG: VapC toxin family PIN domain ribonuclease [Desulfobacca sp.]|nr:VapC toxin family PIN domain ribonuclease [Desulfobacca sp.]